jgi:hypothetical protein
LETTLGLQFTKGFLQQKNKIRADFDFMLPAVSWLLLPRRGCYTSTMKKYFNSSMYKVTEEEEKDFEIQCNILH